MKYLTTLTIVQGIKESKDLYTIKVFILFQLLS